MFSFTITIFTIQLGVVFGGEAVNFNKNGDYVYQPQEDEAGLDPMQENDFDLAQTFLSNGDIRLSTNIEEVYDENSKRIKLTSGRLEVYVIALLKEHSRSVWGTTPGVWGTVCGKGFSMKEAHVACKQMGYARALEWELSSDSEFGRGNQSRPIFLNGLNCPSADTSHIMRCRPSEEPSDSCSHDEDVAIYCDESKETYSGQVRLVNEMENSSMSMSSGRVEIHKNGVWGTVCNKNFNQAAADSVCRQLGYTNALDIYAAQPGEGKVLVDDIDCESSSSCFKSCYNSHHLPSLCNHTTDVAIQCTYDISLSVKNTSGSKYQCSYKPHPIAVLLALGIVSLFSVLVLCVIAGISLCVIYYVFRRRRQVISLYQPLS